MEKVWSRRFWTLTWIESKVPVTSQSSRRAARFAKVSFDQFGSSGALLDKSPAFR